MTSRNVRNALQPGHTVHWYRIDSVLGQGGFGITYLAHDTNLDHPVAIKEFLPMEMAMRDADQSVQPASQEHDERFRWGLDRFLSEARTLARFRHPSIVRVASVFEANNTAYMVMELERGETLHALLARERTLAEDRLRPMLMSLLQGLEVVHGAGFIHRDIKPANVIIRADGTPVLIDFGSARQAIGQQTRTLTTLISPGYAPYEQYLSGGDRQGPWTDIYSLAATMYRCVVGKPPIDALDRSEGLLKSQRDLYMPAIELGQGNYSGPFLRAIDHGMRFRSADRPQSIADWRRELDGETVADVLDTTTRIDFPIASDEHRKGQTSIPSSTNLKSPTAAAPATTPSPPPAAKRSPAPLIIVAIGVVAIGAWLWQRSTSESDGAKTQAGQMTDPPAQEIASTPVPPATAPSPAQPPPSPAAEKLAAARSAAAQAGDDPTRLASSAGQLKEALTLAPDDTEARGELSAIATTLAKQAMDALRDNDPDKAERAVTAAESVDSSAPLVATARRQVDTVRAAASVEAKTNPPTPATPPAPADASPAAVAIESPPASGSAPPAEAGTDAEVAELLRLADADLRANRLTAPRERNAADRFAQVLRLDPGNRDAIAGIDRVADRLADLATSSLARGAHERAGDYVSRGRLLRPDQQRWTTMQTAVEDARKRAAAERTTRSAPSESPERTESPPPVATAPATAAAPASPAAAPAPTPPPPPSPKVSIRVVGIDSDLQRFGLSESDLRSAIGSRLKAAGYDSGDGGLSLKIELKYNRNTTTGIYSYATFVTASGNGSGGRAVQWSADDSGITQERDLVKLKAVMLKEVDEFIAANPAR